MTRTTCIQYLLELAAWLPICEGQHGVCTLNKPRDITEYIVEKKRLPEAVTIFGKAAVDDEWDEFATEAVVWNSMVCRSLTFEDSLSHPKFPDLSLDCKGAMD